jgi:hypothetical protein
MNSLLSRRVVSLISLWLLAASAFAQSGAVGTIEGRVINTRTGEYVERARITVEGKGLETFSDSSGQYRLVNVPAGSVTMNAFHTGLDPQAETITVTPGATVQRNFNLGSTIVKLSEFLVSS